MQLKYIYDGPSGEVTFDSIEKIEQEIEKTKAKVERGPHNLPIVVIPYGNDRSYKNFRDTYALNRIEVSFLGNVRWSEKSGE